MIGTLDLHAEALERIGKAGKAKTPQLFADDELRSAVRKIIAHELYGREVVYDDVHAFWDKRWLWCVNGGHSRALERYEPKWALSWHGHAHRRVAMEEYRRNPLLEWSGECYMSVSPKLEHGKTRLLIASDTISYACFDHLLSAVERAWRNKRVLVDPGRGGMGMICKRVRDLGKGQFYVMLDYDDFNAQHTLRAQQIVIEELAALTGYDDNLAMKLSKSFERMNICVGGERIGVMSATLCSGHRGTSFLNSVLNAAYIYCADPTGWYELKSLHAGDDVVAVVAGPSHAERLIVNLNKVGCKINVMKQSIGSKTAEFLRCAIGDTVARGYLARCIATAVSGSWINERGLGVQEKLTTILTSARAMVNRSLNIKAGLIFEPTLTRLLGVKRTLARALLMGEAAVGNGPIFSGGPCYRSIVLERSTRSENRLLQSVKGYPSNATESYLTSAATEVERAALRITGISVKGEMMGASYAKSLSELTGTQVLDRYRVRLNKSKLAHGWVWYEDVMTRTERVGALTKYPLLHFLKERLTRRQLLELLSMAGYHNVKEPEETAWGGEAHGIRLVGALPYADALALCRRTVAGVVYVKNNIFM